jgi:NAD(P)-dependent dehydrogenase (short-subunit alcohol dehydrogenase family)
MGKLESKVVIVTGASRGIGAAIARLFAAEGAKVICAARTLHEGDHPFEGSLDSTVAAIKAEGGEATVVVADISGEEDCQRLVQSTKEAYGPCDILVNNAALNYSYPVVEYPVNRWKRAFSVSVFAPLLMSQLVLPDMMAQRSGAIVNISSGAGIGPGRGPYRELRGAPEVYWPGLTPYGVTKAALERFTQGLAWEAYEYGISVTAVSPSQIVVTPGTIHHKLAKGWDDPRAEPPELMAKAVLLLATEPLDQVTGRVTYSQQILKEFGWIEDGKGIGVDYPGSGFSKM